MKLSKLAADAGQFAAMLNLGACCAHACGGKVHLPQGMKYSKMAADRGNVSGISNYTLLLEPGHGGEIDLREVSRFDKMAADIGFQQATEAHARLSESQLPKIRGEHPRRHTKATNVHLVLHVRSVTPRDLRLDGRLHGLELLRSAPFRSIPEAMQKPRRSNHAITAVLHFVRKISCVDGKRDSDLDRALDFVVSDLNTEAMEIAANE
jgi:hypothetical protein